jgi:hypothetical protein
MVPTYRRENGKYLKISHKKGIRLIGESTYRRVYTGILEYKTEPFFVTKNAT